MKKEQAIQLIESLSNANGVSGFEDEVIELVKNKCATLGDMTKDGMNNLYVTPSTNTGNRPIVQLDAHSDEVGFIVQAIKPNGTLRFLPIGGWVTTNIPAHRVRVQNSQGTYITGVVASKPPHFMSEEERNKKLDIDDLVIDIGSSSYEETVQRFHVRVGAPVVPDTTFEYWKEHELMLGKAFDCRIGVACMIDVLDEMKESEQSVDIVASLSSQEEVGLRGAKVTAATIQPDIAICFEGCPADDSFSEPYMIQAGLGKGPMLRHFDASMITNPRFQRFALDLAEKQGIPVQESVRKGGSTNGGVIQLVERGVPTIVISVPVRYAHTHYCFVSYEDYAHAKSLACAILQTLDAPLIKTF